MAYGPSLMAAAEMAQPKYGYSVIMACGGEMTAIMTLGEIIFGTTAEGVQ